jgi:threonine/homoserine/homoserine lactone efflux protein
MTDFIPLFLFIFSTTLTPGPNNLLILNASLNFGLKKSLPHFFGICIGFALMVFIVALGFGVILLRYTWIHMVFKVLGAAYMLYLAWQIWHATAKNKTPKPRIPMTFLQAVLFQWMNPKCWMMAVSALSFFILSTHVWMNALLLGIFLGLGTFFFTGIWFIFGIFLERLLKSDRHLLWFNRGMAVLLVASIFLLFAEN